MENKCIINLIPHTKEHSCPLRKLVLVRPAFYSELGERMLILKTKLPSDYIHCGNVEIKTDILYIICIISNRANLWGFLNNMQFVKRSFSFLSPLINQHIQFETFTSVLQFS